MSPKESPDWTKQGSIPVGKRKRNRDPFPLVRGNGTVLSRTMAAVDPVHVTSRSLSLYRKRIPRLVQTGTKQWAHIRGRLWMKEKLFLFHPPPQPPPACHPLLGLNSKHGIRFPLYLSRLYQIRLLKHHKAAVAWEAGKPLIIEQVEVAPPQAMEARVKIKYTSLCHTDLYFWEAKGQTPLFPRIFGHEAAGIVESIGEGVTDLQVGDHVLPVFTGECKECAHCKSEESNMCDLLRINTDRGVMLSDGKSRFSINGNPINHFLGTSTFSEYTVIHTGCLAKIDRLAPLDKVCILSCGISTGLGATLNVAKPKKGSSVAIFGLGAVGLAAAEGARIAGASRIIGVDRNPQRFEEAKKFGVTEFVNPKDHNRPVQEVIAEMTNGGVDRSVECTGNVNAMISAFECVHDGWGVAVLVGVPNKDAVFMTKPINLLNERTLKGTFFGNYKPRTDLPSVVDMYTRKELEVDKFITHRVPFSEINKAFDYMVNGQGLRCIISMEE